MAVNPSEILAIVQATHGQPFKVLGPHLLDNKAVIRAFQPDAEKAWIIDRDTRSVLAEARLIDARGLFEATLAKMPKRYDWRFQNHTGASWEGPDAYSFDSQLSDFDLHLMREGTHYRLWEKLGAHCVTNAGVAGVRFVVWAPNAQRVSVVGDFNRWDGRLHTMRKHEGNGLWEIFIPGLQPGETYKYEVLPAGGGVVMLKADPFAFFTEEPPKSASKIFDLTGYKWRDEDWIRARSHNAVLKMPVSVYEVHLGSWMHTDDGYSLSYRDAATKLARYVKEVGFTHVELMPIMEHPFYGSWGYQTLHFFAPTSRFGTPTDLMEFIDVLHEHGIGVILDWVPAHFPADGHGLAQFDGTHLYEHADPREGVHKDWNTLVFNYGRTEVWNFLLSSALFWMEVYHFDGLRVDAVASMLYRDYSRKEGEWIPNCYGGRENLEAVEFIKHLNVLVHERFPGAVTIAEESTAWTGVSRPTYVGGLGFTFKWNMGWLHDVLGYMSKDPIYRKYHADEFTFSMLYAYTENFVLALSHDEVVYGKGSLLRKMPGDDWQKFANNRLLFGYMFTHPGKKHLFMGMEFGQWDEWDYNRGLDWYLLQYQPHLGLQTWLKDLHGLYREDPAMYQLDYEGSGFRWIDCRDRDNSVYSYLRFAEDRSDYLVVVCNFTPTPRYDYRIGVPEGGWYHERLNSDASIYGGSNMGNSGGVQAEAIPWQGFDWSLALTVPPLACVIFKKA